MLGRIEAGEHTWGEVQLALSEVRQHELLLPEESQVELSKIKLLQHQHSFSWRDLLFNTGQAARTS